MKKINLRVLTGVIVILLFILLIALFIRNIGRGSETRNAAILHFVVLILLIFFIYVFLRISILTPFKSLNKNLSKFEVSAPEEISLEKRDFLDFSHKILGKIEGIFTQLKSKVDELEESRDYVETLMKTVQVAIIVLDKKLAPTYVNDYGKKMFRVQEENIRNQKNTDFIDKKFLSELMDELKDKNNVLNRESEICLKDGKRIDVDVSVSKLFNAADELLGYISIIADITKRKNAERNLKNQISFSQKIFKSIPDMILILDSKLDLIFVNRKAEDLIDTSVIGKNVSSVLSKKALEDGFDEYLRNMINNAEDVKQINVLNPFVEGENYVDILVEPLKSETKIVGGLIIIRDISEWRNLTAKLENLQEFTGKLINASPFAIVSVNEEYNVSVWNENTERIFKVPRDDAIGKNLFDVNPIFDKYKDILNEVMILNKTFSLSDEPLDLGDEIPIVCNVTFYPIFSEGKNAVINIEDISEIKRLEDSLLQAQKMESLGLLTSGIIHDFNNILSGILGYASLLDQIIYADPKLKKYVSNIIASGERASNMVRQILEFSKKKLAKIENLNINEVIEEVLDFLKLNLKNVSLEIELSDKNILISVDKTKVSQVLINLIINAKDALKRRPNPMILITTDEVSIKSRDDIIEGKYAQIKISDNGHGIKKEHQRKIFEPFFSTKPKIKGTGLGLATVKEIIEDYNGTIEVESKFGKGTTFTILIPCVEDRDLEISEEEKGKDLSSIEGTVLLIDDEDVIREIGVDMLNSLDIECITARDGEEGIDLYKKNKDDIKLVILDVEMPGISGEKVYEILKEINPDIKILLASGYGKDYLETKIFKEKIKHFLPKPFQLNQLSLKLSQIMRS